MSHTPHELADEFPAYVQKIHSLKRVNNHFAQLVEKYHMINRAVHRAETHIDAVDDFRETDLRKQRMSLKDEIHRMLLAS